MICFSKLIQDQDAFLFPHFFTHAAPQSLAKEHKLLQQPFLKTEGQAA